MSEHKINPFAKGTTVDLPSIVRDLYGRSLVVGDKVSLNLQAPTLFVVQSIAPVVDPSLPANHMEIIVATRLRFLAIRDQPNAEFARVIAAAETNPLEPQPAEPPRLSLVPEGEAP